MSVFPTHAWPTFGRRILKLSVHEQSVFSIQTYILKFPFFSNPLNFLGVIFRIQMYPDNGPLQLGLSEAGTLLPPALAFWRSFAMRFVAALCSRTEAIAVPPPPLQELTTLIDAAPPMPGGEYLRAEILLQSWRDLQEALQGELFASGSLQEFLKSRDSRWRLVGRVHFNLAENRRDPDFPFAFMATYVSSLAEHGVLRHSPLGQALHDYAGDKRKLLDLLEPVSRAADRLGWLKEIVDCRFPPRLDPGFPLRTDPA